jgi:hypothetical protein
MLERELEKRWRSQNKRRLEGGNGGVYDDKKNREPYVGTKRRGRTYKKIERTNRETQKRDMTKEKGIRI